MSLFKISVAARTDVGQLRPINQDNAFAWSHNPAEGVSRGLLIVADGMGGHQDGEVASRLAVAAANVTLKPWLEDYQGDFDLQTFAEQVGAAYEAANDAIYEYSLEAQILDGDIGTTLECLLLYGEHALFGHVGDSRGYVLRSDGLRQVTVDHSAVGEMVQVGILEPDDRYTHPNRNILTRGLGNGNGGTLEVDVVEIELQPGERVLLCSDGLWGMVRDPEIENVLLQPDALDALAKELIDLANENGGDDNISVAVAELLPA